MIGEGAGELGVEPDDIADRVGETPMFRESFARGVVIEPDGGAFCSAEREVLERCDRECFFP